jgi:predicted lipoprotein with Yx(FWY)xxD motif
MKGLPMNHILRPHMTAARHTLAAAPKGSARSPRGAGIAVLAALIALATTACGSSSKTTTSAGTGGGSSLAPATTAPSNSAPSSGSSTSGVSLMTRSGASGMYVTDVAGRALYLFEPDTKTTSHCNGACATNWPPLISAGMVTAGSTVNASAISTITRAGGAHQVTYHGHPLYYFIADKAAGDTNGQGINAFGGLWLLLTPSGQALAGSSTSSAGSSGSSGNSSY